MEAICNSIDDIHDLLSVSLTCSEMRRIAIRQLLKMHTIRLSTRKSIRGFRDLVINQKPTLAHHLNSIVIPETAWTTYEPAYPSKDVEDVMDILDCAVNLDTLDISLDAPYVVTSRVFSTFATFKVLRDLTLTDAALLPGDASWTHHALGALRSPLVSLCIRDKKHLSSSSLVPSTLASDFDQSFSRFSTLSTLTTLHLGLIPVYEDSFLQLPRFLSVRSLIISRPIVGEPNLAALLHLFPSLDGTLSLRMERVASSSIIFNRAKFNRVREKNQLAQGSSGGWTNLDRLDCEPATAQILALLCPVRHFTTDALDYPSLDVVRPRHLVIDSIRLPFYTDISRHYGDEIASMSASSVTHVVLIVQCEAKEYEDAKKKFEATEDIRWKTVLVSLPSPRTCTHLVFIVDIFLTCRAIPAEAHCQGTRRLSAPHACPPRLLLQQGPHVQRGAGWPCSQRARLVAVSLPLPSASGPCGLPRSAVLRYDRRQPR